MGSLISNENASIEKARIRAAILSLVDEVKDADLDMQGNESPLSEDVRGFKRKSKNQRKAGIEEYEGNYVGQKESSSADTPESSTKKILFLAANPSDQSQIKTNPEHREIKAQLERGLHSHKFEFLPSQFALTLDELQRAFVRDVPNIIHFSGHGEQEGILIEDDHGKSKLLKTNVLKLLFKPFSGKVDIVILNSCYSSEQAEEISKIGAYVLGNKLPVKDTAAASFAVGFYLGLGEGKDFFGALHNGMIRLADQHEGDENVIEVWKDGEKIDV